MGNSVTGCWKVAEFDLDDAERITRECVDPMTRFQKRAWRKVSRGLAVAASLLMVGGCASPKASLEVETPRKFSVALRGVAGSIASFEKEIEFVVDGEQPRA